MRRQNIFRVAARHLNAELARFTADMFLVTQTGRALPAAYPGKNDEAIARFPAVEKRFCIRSDGGQSPFDFVSKSMGKGAALGPVNLIAVPQVNVSILQVNIRMTDT